MMISKLEQTKYQPEYLTNNKESGEKVLSTVIELLEKCEEFSIAVAFATTSGIQSIFATLIELHQRGVKGRFLFSTYQNFTEPQALHKIHTSFPNFQLKVAEDGNFHAKEYMFRNNGETNLIIGSSNLTSGGLSLNKEMNLKIITKGGDEFLENFLKEFDAQFEKAITINSEWLQKYTHKYNQQKLEKKLIQRPAPLMTRPQPNSMQKEALERLQKLREAGEQKALVISATGTGKTYMSAFDVQQFEAKRCLFVVHRRNIAEKARETFKTVFGKSKSFGLYSGEILEKDKDFVFATVQTISKKNHLHRFNKEDFDYVIIDETHRAGAASYHKLIEYFKPKFLLGMTATPERTDGYDIFSVFNHKIAYEIRLHHALNENMLSEFHYYGIQDLTIDGEEIDDKSDFRYLVANERVDHILKKSKLYGTDSGITRGLIFCSRKRECYELSEKLNNRGLATLALTGKSSTDERTTAIERLESDNTDKLDYIITVDVFNEGIDIPKINQIIMLRPTSSAIIFVQQLGRGLRVTEGKSYLTVLDFIGNYQNNFLIPIALYGDTSYNKDTLRKMLKNGSRLIPGSSTVNFDSVTKEKIFESINRANLQTKKDIKRDYDLLLYRLGRHPLMMDFLNNNSRDPFQYVLHSKTSFYEFAATIYPEIDCDLPELCLVLLKYFSREVNNAKRVEESVILLHILDEGYCTFQLAKELIKTKFGYDLNKSTYESAIHNIQLNFATEQVVSEGNKKKLEVISIVHNLKILSAQGERVVPGKSLNLALKNEHFQTFLRDNIRYGIEKYSREFILDNYCKGFLRGHKYSRKECFRILNWDKQPVAQNVGGYMFHPNNYNCAIFLNYNKESDISDTTKYEDEFIDRETVVYMSKNKRKLTSPDVQKFREAKERGIRLPLFVKKANGEGNDFYYIGELTPKKDSFTETTVGGKSVVSMTYAIDHPVDKNLYQYLTGE